MIQPGKLYLTKAHTADDRGDPVLLELKGNVNIMIYGSLNEKDTVEELTPQIEEAITKDLEYTLTGLPRYVVFVGTADIINVQGYDLTFIKNIV